MDEIIGSSMSKVLVIVGNDYEERELWGPVLRLREDGEVKFVGAEKNVVYTGYAGVDVTSDYAFADVNVAEFDALVAPGGWYPDSYRVIPECKKMIQDFKAAGKTIGFICHGGWLGISAGVLKGVKLTSNPNIRDDFENAGATWVNESVVIDGQFVTSQSPDTVPAFCKALVEVLAK